MILREKFKKKLGEMEWSSEKTPVFHICIIPRIFNSFVITKKTFQAGADVNIWGRGYASVLELAMKEYKSPIEVFGVIIIMIIHIMWTQW